MTYKAIAIDDEQFALDDLGLVISRIPGIELIAVFQTGDDALNYLYVNGPVDVIFCDLDLEGTGDTADLAGLRMAKELKAWCALFYFFTGHPAYRIPALETAAAGYLMKPVNPDRIEEGLMWIAQLKRRHNEIPDQLLIRDVASGDRIAVAMDEICCLCTHPLAKNHIEVVRKDKSSNVTRGTLKAMYERVRHSGLFIQLSQSAAVAKLAIVSERNGLVKVTSGHLFPISKDYKQAFDHYLSQFV